MAAGRFVPGLLLNRLKPRFSHTPAVKSLAQTDTMDVEKLLGFR